MTTEERLSRVEGAFEQVDKRLGDLTQAVTALRQEMHEGQAALRQEMSDGNTALRQEMSDGDAAMRREMSEGHAAFRGEVAYQVGGLRSEMNDRFNNLYLLAGGAWVSTTGIMVGLFSSQRRTSPPYRLSRSQRRIPAIDFASMMRPSSTAATASAGVSATTSMSSSSSPGRGSGVRSAHRNRWMYSVA